MTFLSSLSLSSSSSASRVIDDAPLADLPAEETAAITELERQVGPLFTNEDATSFHAEDPVRALSPELRRYLLLRFVRYHLLDATAAATHLRRLAGLRRAERPWHLSLSLVHDRKAGVVVWVSDARGRDGEGLMYFATRRYVRSEVDHEVQQAATKAFFEHCLYAGDGPRATCGVMVVDFRELGIKNVDLVGVQHGIRIFLEHYPESFKKIVFVNYPKWVYGTWKAVAQFLDRRTVAKVVWAATCEAACEEVGKYFEKKELPTWLGGTVELESIELENGERIPWLECVEGMQKRERRRW